MHVQHSTRKRSRARERVREREIERASEIERARECGYVQEKERREGRGGGWRELSVDLKDLVVACERQQ